MKQICQKIILLILLSPLTPSFTYGLANNVVRTDSFEWMKVQTDHFDIYYDKKSEKLLPRMAHYIERAWHEVGDQFGYSVPERTPFFFYSNHNKFEQTNIAFIGEGTGGVTEAFKNRLVVFNDGSEEWMRHVIFHEFVHVLEFNVLYTGLFRSVQLFIKSPFYPLWVMEGMAEWGSGDVDEPTTHMVIRDAVANKILPELPELHGFSHLKPNQVTLGYKTGEVAIQFLEDEYGKDKVLKLLSSMRDHFDISSSLEQTIGSDLYRFDFRFQEWIQEKFAEDIASSKQPKDYGPKITPADGIPLSNESPVISPDGKKLYFLSDQSGPTRVYELDIDSNEASPLFSIDWSSFENLHTRGRGMSISKDGRWLALAGEKIQQDYLYLYDLKEKKMSRIKVPFDEIRFPVFSPTDENLVCVGLNEGFTDLYIISREGDIVKRLTDSPQYESSPVFSRDGLSVVYSAEMLTADGNGPAGSDLFSIDINTLQMTHITQFHGKETEPEILPDGSLVFVRDQDESGRMGSDLFQLSADRENVKRLTKLVGGALSPRYSQARNKLFYVGFNAGERHVYEGAWEIQPAHVDVAEETPVFDDELDSSSVPGGTLAAAQWPASMESPLLNGPARPYRFRGSTDLFLPFFLYSTQSGFAAVALWQYSDMLNNHTLQQQMQYASGSDFYDIATFYTYSRFRPSFTVGGRAERYYRDFDEQEQRKEVSGVLVMSYPMSRVNSLLMGVGATDRTTVFFDGSEVDEDFQDRYYSIGFSHDTVSGRYLVPTRGNRLGLIYQQGGDSVGGNQSYKTGAFEAVRYTPLARESTIASKLFYGRSVGRDSQVFRFGGVDKIRALSDSEANKKSNVVYGNAELRYRLKYLNARTKFLFPDFFFKAAYLIVFDDVGFGWDTRAERQAFDTSSLENSAGVGISWPTFILQTFKLDFTVLWAKKTTTGSDVWYITLGPSF